jgi:hypothetical protein
VGVRVSGGLIAALAAMGLLQGLLLCAREPNSGIVVLWQWVVMGSPAVGLLLKGRAILKLESASDFSEAADAEAEAASGGRFRTWFGRVPVYRRVLFGLLALAAVGVVGYALLADYIASGGSASSNLTMTIFIAILAMIGPPLLILGVISEPLQHLFYASAHFVSSSAVLFGVVYYLYLFLPLGLKLFTRHSQLQGRWLTGIQIAVIVIHLLLVPLSISQFRM